VGEGKGARGTHLHLTRIFFPRRSFRMTSIIVAVRSSRGAEDLCRAGAVGMNSNRGCPPGLGFRV